MPELFDPYHRWLGIAAKDQPANHYRLLAIDLFESDREVIRDASEQRMAHVRSYQLGEHLECSQRILNELATAKACLLDPNKKAAYDASLVATMMPSPAIDAPPIVYGVASSSLSRNGSPDPPRPSETRGRSFRQRLSLLVRPSEQGWVPLILVVCTVASLLIIGLAFCLRGIRGPKVSSGTESPQSATLPPDGTQKDAAPAHGQPPARPPQLTKVPEQRVTQGEQLRFRLGVSDPGTTGGKVRYSLMPDAPEGATIATMSGVFQWTPTREQKPGVYRITVRAQGDRLGDLADETTFRVIVQKAPESLTFLPQPSREVPAGSSCQWTMGVKTPADAEEYLTFSLHNAPPWMSVDPNTGEVTCSPGPQVKPRRYSVTVRVACETGEVMPAETTFVITVLKPEPGRPMPKPGDDAATTASFEIQLPSGRSIALADLDILTAVRQEATRLLGQSLSDAAHTARSSILDVTTKPAGPKGAAEITVLTGFHAATPNGQAVFLYPSTTRNGRNIGLDVSRVKQYVVYKMGKWDGLLAAWDEKGQREFWCEYAAGRRHGLCCLFHDDQLAAILECTQNNITAVHLITANEITRSLTNMSDAAADPSSAHVCTEINAIESRLKKLDRAFLDHFEKERTPINPTRRSR